MAQLAFQTLHENTLTVTVGPRAGNRRTGLVKIEGTRTFSLGKSLFLSRHVRGLQYHGISPNLTYCFVRGKVMPQVKILEDPYHTWVILTEETGQIVTAECSCCIGVTDMARRRLEAAIRVGKEIDDQQKAEDDFFKSICESGSMLLDEKMMGVYSLQFSLEGDKLAVGCGNGAIVLLNSQTGQVIRNLHQGSLAELPVLSIAYHPSRPSTLLSAGSNGCISLWDLPSSREIDTVIEAHNEINTLDFCLDGGTYATAGKDLSVRLYSAETNKLLNVYEGSKSLLLDKEQLSEFGHGMRIFALRFHPDENSIFVTGGWDNQLKIWDSRTPSGVQRSIPGPHICGNGLDIKNDKILTASWVNQDALQLWDVGTGRLEQVVPLECDSQTGEYLYCAQFCDGQVVLAGGSGTNDVQAVNSKSYENLGSVSLGQKSVQALDSTNGGRLFAVGGIGGQVKIASLR